MTHGVARHRFRLLLMLAGVLVTLCISLALSAPSASASPYCGGTWLTNYGICYGAERSMTGVSGYGLERSVCVGIAPISGNCSGGPRQLASFNWGSAIYSSPYIQDNAPGGTIVWGETH
jgi:hypothetical protein